jgi:uncharacterized membrane protein
MKLIGWLRATLVSGILAILPIVITVYVLWLLYRAIDTPLRTLLEGRLGGFWVPGLGILIAVLIVLFVGILTRIYIGRKFYGWLERIFFAAPIVRKMYATTKQIINAIFNRDVSSFQKVVLIEYPRKGVYTIGFLTNDNLGEIQESVDEKVVSVFTFTAPSPLSGVLLIVPERDVTYLDVSIDEGFRTLISMGISVPPSRSKVAGKVGD